MGLLDSVAGLLGRVSDPEVSGGLLSAGQAMLQGGAVNQNPMLSLTNGAQAFDQSRNAYQDRQYMLQQRAIQQAAQQLASQDAMDRRNAIGQMSPDLQTLFKIDPDGAMKFLAASIKQPQVNGEVQQYQFYAQQELAAGRQPKSFNDWATDMKRAGAANTTIAMPKAVNTQLGELAAKRLDSSYGDVVAAQQSMNSADQIERALNSGNVVNGPGAGLRLGIDRIANLMNAGGKNADEKLANTQQLIQGLAQLTLQGRQQMHGQGAITEGESALAQNAMSGNFNMTGPELLSLVNAARRAARFKADQYNQFRNQVLTVPDTAQIAGLYPEMTLGGAAPPIPALPTNITEAAKAELRRRLRGQ